MQWKTVWFITKYKHKFAFMVFLLVVQCVHNLNLALWQTAQKAWSHSFPVAVFFFFFALFAFWRWDCISKPSEVLFQKGVERPSVMKFVIRSSLWRRVFLFIHSKPSLSQWNISLPVLWISPNTSDLKFFWSEVMFSDVSIWNLI